MLEAMLINFFKFSRQKGAKSLLGGVTKTNLGRLAVKLCSSSMDLFKYGAGGLVLGVLMYLGIKSWISQKSYVFDAEELANITNQALRTSNSEGIQVQQDAAALLIERVGCIYLWTRGTVVYYPNCWVHHLVLPAIQL